MLTTIRDLKGAFIALVPRMNGLPLGRTGFQDFEIAYFLNLAYDKLLQQRINTVMNEYTRAFSEFEQHSLDIPRRDMSCGGLISEFGTLYRSSVHLPDWDPVEFPFARANLLWNSKMSRIFEIMPVNGFLPYIIGCDLFEKFIDQKTTRREDRSISVTYPVRILNETEVLKYAVLLNRNPNALPYRIGRIRADVQLSYTATVESTIGYLDSILTTFLGGGDDMEGVTDRTTARRQVYLLELLHNKQYNDSIITCSMQYICHPEPVTEVEIATESGRFLEVSFGHEIAETAAAMASGLLSTGQQQQQHHSQKQ